MFMTTNRTRMILPEECARFRFGVGHAEFGFMYFKPLSDSHLAQHFAMLGIVSTEVCYMTKVTSENNGSPQITRVLRDREAQADMVSTLQISGSAAYTLARVKTVQDLILVYEKSVGAAAPANLAVSFEQVSGEAQYGGAPKSDVPTVGGGGPAATAAAGSFPVVGTTAHSPATRPFGPNQVQEFTAAQVELDGLTARRLQMSRDNEICTPLFHSSIAAEREGAVEGLRMVRTQVLVWQRRSKPSSLRPTLSCRSLLLRADGSEREVVYNGYRILIEQVIVLATRELNLVGSSPLASAPRRLIIYVHAPRDLPLPPHPPRRRRGCPRTSPPPPPPPALATPTAQLLDCTLHPV
jgi:hypothetical protein